MVGVPVIINHKDITAKNANDERVGVVSNVWFDDKDGWYWCDGVIWDETAQNLITDKGWSVSCSYDVKLADDAGGTENNIPYDIEFLDGVFTHLAIVDNPRYERANIVFNSKTVVQNFNPNHDEEGKFCSGSNVNYASYEEYETEFFPYIEEAPPDYETNNFEEALKDLGITEEKPLKISNPYETVNVTFESIKHIIGGGGDGHEPDTSRYKSINKMLATLKDPNLITEDNNGKKRYFKLFDDKNKVKRQFVILFNENDVPTVYTTMPVNKDKKYFINQVNAGTPVYKKGQTGVIKNSAANTIITDNREDFNPMIKNNEVDNDKWITIKPHGKDSDDYRRIKLEDGETPKEAIERTYGKEKLTKDKKEYTWKNQKYSLQDLVDAGFEPIKYTSSIFKDDPLTYLAKEEGKKYYRMPLTESEYQEALKAKENKKTNALLKAKKESKDLIDYVKWQYSEDIEPYITRKEGNKIIVDWYDLPRGAKSALQQIQRGGRLSLDMYSGREMSIEIKDKKILENLQRYRANNNKEQDMALLDELKKLITTVENEKPEGEDMDENEVKNEKVDKRKLIDEVAGIMKSAGADDEKIRTAIAKMEKLAYDKSEAGTADNECDDEEEVKNKKVKNEDEEDEKKYEDLKKDVKEDVENKCKNSVDNTKGGYFDKMNEIYNTATQPSEENTYISREQKLKYAEEYFAK